MRGTDETSGSLFSYVDLEDRIPARHPLRKIRQVVNDAVASLDGEFVSLCADFGRPSIAPERLIRASLIQILFSVRSERQLMEQMQYNLMFRWFVGLGIDDPVWVATVFTKNRDRLLTTDMSRKVMAAILAHREVASLLWDEHFLVDGTLIKAWASMKSFQPKAESTPPDDGGPDDPPTPSIDPDKQLTQSEPEPETEPETELNRPAPITATLTPRSTSRARSVRTQPMLRPRTRRHGSTRNRPAPVRRCASWVKEGQKTVRGTVFPTTALMENRHGLVVQGDLTQADLTQADGHAERRAAMDMVHRHSPGSTRRLTLGADKGYDAAGMTLRV
jgi:transposase